MHVSVSSGSECKAIRCDSKCIKNCSWIRAFYSSIKYFLAIFSVMILVIKIGLTWMFGIFSPFLPIHRNSYENLPCGHKTTENICREMNREQPLYLETWIWRKIMQTIWKLPCILWAIQIIANAFEWDANVAEDNEGWNLRLILNSCHWTKRINRLAAWNCLCSRTRRMRPASWPPNPPHMMRHL